MARPLLIALTAVMALASRVPSGAAPVSPTGADSTEAWQRYFNGNWHCGGGFPSGRKLEATITFSNTLGGRFLSYHHSDAAPGTYEATALWGRQGKDSALLSVQHDIGGGVRVYRSTGWVDDALTWTRDSASLKSPGSVASAPDRFTYRKNSDSTFWFGWELPRPGGAWVVGDSLTCRRA